MATLYITTNANTGTGSLRSLLSSAESGDVIVPDATLFPERCEIALTSALTFPEGVELDGSQARIVLDCSGISSGVFTLRDGTKLTRVDVVEFDSNSTGGVIWLYGWTVFSECGFYGNSAARGVFYVRNGATLDARTCVVAGNRGTNDASICYLVSSTGSTAFFTASTLVGNVSSTGEAWNAEPTLVDCKTTGTGLFSFPTFAYADWTADAWRSWDLRLRPGTPDATGATGAYAYDFVGNARSGSLGAYEAIDADLYWIGLDANGDPVADARFDLATGWSSDPTATSCGATAANSVARLFVGSSVAFADAWETDEPDAVLSLGANARVSATLTGQRVENKARGSSITLSGAAEVRGGYMESARWTYDSLVLTCVGCLFPDAVLTIPAGVAVLCDDCVFLADALNLSGSLATTSLALTTLVMGSEARLELLGVDPILKITESATLGGTIVGGYVAAPVGTSATFDGARFCTLGAKVTSLSATKEGTTASLAASVDPTSDPEATVVFEKQVGTNRWDVIATTTARTVSTTIPSYQPQIATAAFRVFDGTFHTAFVHFFQPPAHTWVDYDQIYAVELAPKWLVITDYQMQSVYYNAGETPIFFARVTNSATNEPVDPETVESVTYTCFKKVYSWGSTTLESVEGHLAAEVPVSAVLDEIVSPETDPRWTRDATGYNFVFEPNTREHALFPSAGDYRVVFNIDFTTGNSAPIVYDVSVK